jgi:Putative adhesin
MNRSLKASGLITAAVTAALLSGCSGGAVPVRSAQVTTDSPVATATATAAPTAIATATATPAPVASGTVPGPAVTTESVPGITALVIDSGSGRIQVTGSDATQVVVTRRTFATRARPTEQVTTTGGTLKISSPHCAADDWPAAPCRIDYEIQVPRGLPVQVAGASGDLTLAGLTGTQSAVSASGNVTVTDARGPVTAGSTSGDVEISAAAVLSSLTATSTSGNVSARVPAGSYRIEATTASGEADVALPSTAGAPALIRLTTVGGDVTLGRS